MSMRDMLLPVGVMVAGALPTKGAESEAAVVFYLPFEGTPNATVGVAPEAEVHDGAPEYVPGKRGAALRAGDGQAYLSFDAANVPAREGTLEFWFKPLNWDGVATDTFHVFVETDQDAGGHWFLVYKYFAAQNAAFIWENGGSIFQRKISGWRDWVHFAVTWSPTGCRLYFNGVPSAVTVPKNPPDRYVGRMKVGDRPWHLPRDEQTLIDELYIYDRALEPEEITWAMENAETRPAGQDVLPGLVPTKVYAKILPSSGRIQAQVRHRLAPEILSDVTGTAELLGPTPLAAVPLTVQERTAEAILRFDKLAPGEYTLRVAFRDAAGGIIEEAMDRFFCPTNEWLGNTLGITATPPPPWTPIEASDNRLACWGRTYVLAPSGLPQSIHSAGAALLAQPVQLQATTQGQPVPWIYQAPKLTQQSEVSAEYAGQWESEIGQLSWQSLAEYDGMIKYTLTLNPAPHARVDRLELRFPLRPEHATLHHGQLARGTVAGATPAGEGTVVQDSGANYWWLGDEERGLLAFRESDEAWDRIDRPDGFRIERTGASVEAVWSFIAGPTLLSQPWSFTFGLTATPVKDTTGQRGRPSRVLPMNPWLMPRPQNYTSAGVEDMIANEGIRDKMWSNFLVLWGGGEWRTYNQDWGRPEAYREGLDRLAAQGLAVLTYMMPREIPESVPEWRFWSAEWGLGEKTGWTDEVWDSSTCVRSWVDFTVWYRMQALRRYGFAGFYLDNGTPRPGRNLDVGVGYLRDGRVRPTIPYFGLREVFKRLYTAVKQYGREQNKPTLLMTHVSSEWPVACLGFMDNRLDGEQYLVPVRKEGKRYHDLIPLDKWRALNLSANVGSMAVFLPEFPQEDLQTATPTRQLLGLLLLHDMIGVWFTVDGQAHAEAVYRMWRVQDDFGVPDAELLPYWKNNDLIAGQTDTLKASAYRKPGGGALIVIGNLSPDPQTAALTVDWNKLKSAKPLSVVDAETGEPVEVRDNRLQLNLAPLDYLVVWCQ